MLEFHEEKTIDIAMIGLGKMGANMTKRLLDGGHRVVAFDLSPEAVKTAEDAGAIGAYTLDEVAIPVITLALQRRFHSRTEAPFGDKLLSAMRSQFGGHAIKPDK